jgi:hypothetical protein
MQQRSRSLTPSLSKPRLWDSGQQVVVSAVGELPAISNEGSLLIGTLKTLGRELRRRGLLNPSSRKSRVSGTPPCGPHEFREGPYLVFVQELRESAWIRESSSGFFDLPLVASLSRARSGRQVWAIAVAHPPPQNHASAGLCSITGSSRKVVGLPSETGSSTAGDRTEDGC